MGPKALLLMAATVMATLPIRSDDHKAGGVVIQEFSQRLNHSINATSHATFDQKYQLDTRFFKPGGPIFFIQSAETGMSSINSTDFVDYAPKLGGMVAMLEHRFFANTAESNHPAHITARNETSSSKMTYPDLTLENVLQDGADFVDWIKNTVEGANESKAIYGGSSSYGGFLAVSARIRHPSTFWGAIASSPALNSFGPLDTNRFRFDAAKQTDIIYRNMSGHAYDKIKVAMSTFDKCVEDNNCPDALPDLDICSGSNHTNYTTLYNAAVRSYTLIPQFNYPYVDRYPTAYPFQDLIAKTLIATTPGQILRAPLLAASWAPSPRSCIDPSNANLTSTSTSASLTPGGLVPMYAYVRCAYYPLNTLPIPADNMLPSALARGPVDLCGGGDRSQAWPEPPDYRSANEYFVQKFAVTNGAIDRAGRLLVVQGAYDRTAAVGTPALTDGGSGGMNHSAAVVVGGLAHAEDVVSEGRVPRGVKAELDHIRDVKMEYIKEWLGQGTQEVSESTTTTPGLRPLVAFATCGLVALIFL